MAVHYKKPPIVEAVIDIKFDPILNLDIAKLVKRYEKDFPLPIENLLRIEPYRLESDGSVVQNFVSGTRLTGANGDDILLIAQDGITTSRLAPYNGWEMFLKRFQENWHTFIKCEGERKLRRIGLRFINRIDIPTLTRSNVDISEYFSLLFQAPANEGLGIITGFSVATQWKHPSSSWIANLALQAVPPALVEHFSFVLDIDVILLENLPSSEKHLIESLNDARSFKNTLFESSIKDSLREIFNS